MDIREYLDGVHASLKGTAPGPWHVFVDGELDDRGIGYAGLETEAVIEDKWASSADLQFIARAREDVPRLVAVLESVLAGLDARDEYSQGLKASAGYFPHDFRTQLRRDADMSLAQSRQLRDWIQRGLDFDPSVKDGA